MTWSRAPSSLVQLVEGQVHAVVGEPVLGEVVGADPLGAVTAADLELAGLGLRRDWTPGLGKDRAWSSDRARALFLCWERSSWHSTTMPEGRW